MNLLVLVLMLTHAASSDEVVDPTFNHEQLDQFFDHLYEHNRYMGSIGVLSGDELVYLRADGYADAEAGIENTYKTKFPVGSVTKPFTATLVMQLAEEGKLSTDDKLEMYYPEFPNAGDVSIEMLLHHRSGIFSFTNDPDYMEWMNEYHSREEMLEIMKSYEPVFEPDSKTEYSNTNYVLLGYILEDVTGSSYQELLKKRITEPAELTETYYGKQISTERNEAFSYSYDDGWNIMPETDMSVPHGAGAIVSTPEDLVRFAQTLFSGELVSEESLEKMTSIRDGFGLGLIEYPYYDKTGFGHTGGIDGYQANLAIYPDDDLYVAFTTNALSYSNNELLVAILDTWHGREITLPDFDSVELSEDFLAQYEGEYASEQIHLEISLWVEDGSLMAQGTGQPAFPLDAGSETLFRFEQAGVVIDFETTEESGSNNFVLRQGGQEFLFEKK